MSHEARLPRLHGPPFPMIRQTLSYFLVDPAEGRLTHHTVCFTTEEFSAFTNIRFIIHLIYQHTSRDGCLRQYLDHFLPAPIASNTVSALHNILPSYPRERLQLVFQACRHMRPIWRKPRCRIVGLKRQKRRLRQRPNNARYADLQ